MRALRWVPAALLVIGAAVAGIVMLGDDEPDPVEIDSSARPFESLGELAAASDLVVVASVSGIDHGRAVGASDDPRAVIGTRLVRLAVQEVLIGEPVGDVVVEEADELGDGSPAVADGMTRLQPGDVAIWFLVAGGSEAMPYYAAVNGQARFVVRGDTLEPSGDDELSRELAALGPDGLAGAVRLSGS